MKKLYASLLAIVVLFSLSFPAYAAENPGCLITSGHTQEGIYYEVHGETSLPSRSDSISVTRQITYDGKITPEKEIFWQESIGGVTYAGTLKIVQCNYNNNQTIAVYKGVLRLKK